MRDCEAGDCWKTATSVYRPAPTGPGRDGVALCDRHAAEVRGRARRDIAPMPGAVSEPAAGQKGGTA
jgi:hypothetical protein